MGYIYQNFGDRLVSYGRFNSESDVKTEARKHYNIAFDHFEALNHLQGMYLAKLHAIELQ